LNILCTIIIFYLEVVLIQLKRGLEKLPESITQGGNYGNNKYQRTGCGAPGFFYPTSAPGGTSKKRGAAC
jgi:hypothetical protein